MHLIRHCVSCDVDWAGPDPCWICGEPGRPGAIHVENAWLAYLARTAQPSEVTG